MYRRLSLRREGIDNKIKEYFRVAHEMNVEIDIRPISSCQELFTIIFDTRDKILFDLYSNKEGKYTFNFNNHGVNENDRTEFLFPMANWLKEVHCFGVRNNNFVVENISQEEFKTIIELLLKDESEYEYEPLGEISSRSQCSIKSRFRDKIYLTYYPSSNKILIQGRPLYLYWKVVKIILDYHSVSENEAFKMVNTSDTPKDKKVIEKIVQESYNVLYQNLNQDLKKFLSVYIALKDGFDIELEDYSIICFPIFKLSEGFLRQILSDELSEQGIFLEEKGFSIDLQNSKVVFENSALFYQDGKTKKFLLNFNIGGIEISKRDKINNLYDYFHKQRNSGSHGKEDNGSRIIETFSEACYIGNELLRLINDFF